MELKNTYNADTYVEKIKDTEFFKKLQEDYDEIIIDLYNKKLYNSDNNNTFLPSELMLKKVVPLELFYYLDFLDIKSSDVVYDLGCGRNWLKTYYPNIIGVDMECPQADIKDVINDEFVHSMSETMDKIIAINSLHYINFIEFEKVLDWIYKLLKPGGKAFITLNTKTLIQNTDKSHMNSIYTKDGTQTFNNNMKQYILDQCEKSPLNFIVCDIFKGSLHEYVYGAGVSGTVRLIAQKD